jgi:2-amino-4-hydroxy-6-hydroxymethyldihydropteridine diphosphokinase
MKQPAKTVTAYIGIGSNLGDPAANVNRALSRLTALSQTTLERHSSLFRTAPIEAQGDDFVNAVAMLQTSLSATELLRELQAIEREFGRERSHLNAPRTLDLDILLFGTDKISTADLTIPHPRLVQRAFALIPLLQIDPFITIPGFGPAHVFVPDVSGQMINKIAG